MSARNQNITDILHVGQLAWTFFRNSCSNFIFENGEGRTNFYFPW